MKKIRLCSSCGTYTLSERCSCCGEKTINPHPPRYSPEDRYGDYRRKQFKKAEKE